MKNDERRERYAAALAATDCERWGIPVPDKGHEFWRTWYALADAAMAVADAEQHKLREEMRTAFWEQHEQIARERDTRIKAEQDLARLRDRFAVAEQCAMRAERHVDTIIRVRSVLDDEALTAREANAAARAALEGEQ